MHLGHSISSAIVNSAKRFFGIVLIFFEFILLLFPLDLTCIISKIVFLGITLVVYRMCYATVMC